MSRPALMMRSFAVALAIACTTAASAEPILVRAIVDIDHQHGCSQSVENRGIEGLLTLELGDDGTATMSLETHEITVFGPSLGRFRQGDTEFSDRRWKDRRTWHGHVERSGEQWTVRFVAVEGSHVDQPQYGDLPYPQASPSVTSLVLQCQRMPVAVYPPVVDEYSGWDTEGQQPAPVDAVICMPDQELFDLSYLVTVDFDGADIVSFDIDDEYVWFTAMIRDPDPPEALDD